MIRFLVGSFVILGLLILFGGAVNADLEEGLILHFNFDEADGAEIIDSSANGNNGEIQAGAKRAPGKFDSGLELDGTTQFALIPYNESMDATDGVTMAIWAMPDDPAAPIWLYYLVSKWNYHAGDGRCYFIGLLEAGGVTFFLSSDGTDAAMSRLDAGEIEYGADKWQHIVGTFDGSDLRIYIDGEEVGKQAWNDEIFVHDQGMSLGAGSFGGEAAARFTGIIDEVAVYNRGLTEDEIGQLMAAPLGAAVALVGKLATTWGVIKTENQ